MVIQVNEKTVYMRIFFIIGAFIIVLLPIIIYICYFHSHSISEIPSEWGAFGDYLGGLLNPILSVFSTLLLAYITILLKKESSKEAFNTRLIEKKQNAYSDVFQQLALFEQWECSKAKYEIDLSLVKKRFDNLSHQEKDRCSYQKELEKLLENCISNNVIILKRMNLYVDKMPIHYNHIFVNTFCRQEYIDLKESFVYLLEKVEKFDFRKENSLKNIPDSSIRQYIDSFLCIMKSEINT